VPELPDLPVHPPGTIGRTLRTQAIVALLGAGTAAAGATAIEVRDRWRRHGKAALRPSADLVRNVLARMTTPLLPDDYLHLVNPLWTAREIRGRVVKVQPETDDAATLVIRPGWGWSFDYQPGQFAGIGVPVDGKWVWRSYSLTSAPHDHQQHIAITVKAMPEGQLSSHLVRGLEPGTIVRLALPQGEFVIPDPPPPKVLFWTGGSGITPVTAMLRTFARRGTIPDVVHIHGAPSRDAFIFGDELEAMAEKYDCYRLDARLGDEHFTVEELDEACPDWRERQAWVCGPTPMLDAAEEHWRKAGLGDQLHLERFSANLSSTAEGGTVTFAKSDKTADVDGATTLLEAGEAEGIQMPFGCRMGICHTCMVTLKSGTAKDLRDGTEYHDNQRIQTCVSAAAGDCTLDV
jgi:ferredoxin-NADP reductase